MITINNHEIDISLSIGKVLTPLKAKLCYHISPSSHTIASDIELKKIGARLPNDEGAWVDIAHFITENDLREIKKKILNELRNWGVG